MKFTPGETNIICTNVDNSLKFYKEILGFEFVEQDGIAIRLKNGNNNFLLLAVAKSPRIDTPYCTSPEYSLDLLVSNLTEAKSYLESNNIKIEKADEYSVIIRDPDGLVIEVIQNI